MKWNRKTLALKINAGAYGADPVPTATANFLVAQNVDITPVEMELDAYNPVSSSFGEEQKIIGARWSTVSFDVLVGGGGAPLGDANTVPNHDALLRVSGFARTLSAGVSTLYSLINNGEEHGVMYYWNDGMLHVVRGLRGKLAWNYSAKRAAIATFTGMGLATPSADQGMPAETLPVIPRPVAVNSSNTTLLIGSYSASVSAFTLDLGSDVQYLNRLAQEEVSIVGRQMSGRITLQLPSIAEQDFIGPAGLCTLGTPVNLTLNHGTQAGNIVRKVLTGAQLLQPKLKNEQGMTMLEATVHVPKNRMEITYL
jgi:hypothetical protein